MKEYTKQFTFLLILFILVTAGFAYFNYITTQRIDQKMDQLEFVINQQVAALNQKIEQTQLILESDIAKETSTLKSEIETISQEVQTVEQQTQQQFQGLSGQIQGLEETSLRLEEDILSINVQSKDFTVILDSVIPAIVSIRTNQGLGSGVIIHEDGYVITNYHIIENIDAASVTTYDQRRYSLRIVGTDKQKDLAVIKINSQKSFKRLKFGSSRTVRLGEKVIALGNPGGLDFTVTEGIISALSRESAGVSYLQHDVAINPGNSGGPLVNVEGRIIGINTLKKVGFEGIGFAIEADIVKDFADSIIQQDIDALAAEQG